MIDRFEFPGDEALYRGFRGERIVAECEGQGVARVLAHPDPARLGDFLFHDWFSLRAEDPGRCLVEIERDEPTGDAREIDRFCPADPAARVRRAWEARNVGENRYGLCLLTAASFDLFIPPAARALRLEKRYDRFHGRQRARILLNGHFCANWYLPRQDRGEGRLATESIAFGIEETGRARLTIEPYAATALFTLTELVIFAL